MSINLSNLSPAKGAHKARKRIGRGGKRGSYSGKGMKGQRSRSGVSGLKELGFKQTLQRIPKLRGFRSIYPKLANVNIAELEKNFSAGEVVDLKKLLRAGLVDKSRYKVKILGDGQLTKKLTVIAQAYSAKAKEAIEAAGGRAEIKK